MNVDKFFTELPTKVNPDALEGLTSLFHFDLKDDGQYTVQLDNGKMSVTSGLSDQAPTCKVTTSAENLSKLLKGDLNPMMAVMTGKIKISNPTEMMKYAKIFGLM